jgi:transcription antitermination factor NusG
MNQSYAHFAEYQASQWYAVYTRHQHEKSVAENLAGRGLEVFLPAYEAIRQWGDRLKRLSLPLFPCYVFFRGNLENRVRVLSTPGVHSIVGFAGQPAVIESSEIEAIRVAVESHFAIEPHPFLRHGDRVRVKCGPLAGIEGILVRKRGLARLVLSAELLQKSVSVEVDAYSIERVACRPEFALRPITGISSSHFKNTTG